MTPLEREAIRALRFDYSPVHEDIWRAMPFHVEGLHPEAERAAVDALDDVENSEGSSPLGLVIQGQRGVGKTHMLGWVRVQTHSRRGYFFMVSLLDDASLWESVLASMAEGLAEPWGGEKTQAEVMMFLLGNAIGAPIEIQKMMVGKVLPTRQNLDVMVRLLRVYDRKIGQRCSNTVRAMALFVSKDPAHQEVAEGYLQSLDDEEDQRTAWGIRRKPCSAEELISDLTTLMAITGPVVIAVDQVDTLLAQAERTMGDTEEAERAVSARVERIAGGLMSLRERTRRTLTLLACLPSSWLLIKERATDTVQDRFRETAQLESIPSASIGRSLVEKRFAHQYAKIGFKPEFPSWPVDVGAFSDAPGFTPRQLLKEVERHRLACENRGEVLILDRFDPVRSPMKMVDVRTPPVNGSTELAFAALDKRFADLCVESDPTEILEAGSEDKTVPPLLSAGLAAWVMERGGDRDAFSVDPPPGRRPALHARLRQTIDEETEDQLLWSFRAIGATHPLAALSRLRKASTAAGVLASCQDRKLYILRRIPFSNGKKTKDAVVELKRAGGECLDPSDGDLRVLIALRQLLDDGGEEIAGWLESRQIATGLKLFSGLAPTTRSQPEHWPPPSQQPSKPALIDPEPSEPVSPGLVPLGQRVGDDEMAAIPLESFRTHVAVFAGSGSGKTVLLRRLVEECALRGVSSIVLDPNNDLARLGDSWPQPPDGWRPGDDVRAKEYLDQTEVVVWTPRREAGRPLSFRPLPELGQVRDDVDEFNEAVDVAVASVAPRLNLLGSSKRAELGRAVLREAIEHCGRRGNSDVEFLARLLAELPVGVSQLTDADKIAAELSQLLRAAMVNDPLFGGKGTPMDPGELLTPSSGKRARVSVVSFVGLVGESDRQSFVNQLQMSLFAWIKRNPAVDRPLLGLLVMDEAQNFAPAGGMTASTKSTLALASQARKYGLGLVFATQAPKGLHNQVPGNAATQLFGRLNSPAQIQAVKEMAAAKQGRVPDIGRLDRGRFYLASESRGFEKIQSAMCLSHHPPSPLTSEEVVNRARRSVQS